MPTRTAEYYENDARHTRPSSPQPPKSCPVAGRRRKLNVTRVDRSPSLDTQVAWVIMRTGTTNGLVLFCPPIACSGRGFRSGFSRILRSAIPNYPRGVYQPQSQQSHSQHEHLSQHSPQPQSQQSQSHLWHQPSRCFPGPRILVRIAAAHLTGAAQPRPHRTPGDQAPAAPRRTRRRRRAGRSAGRPRRAAGRGLAGRALLRSVTGRRVPAPGTRAEDPRDGTLQLVREQHVRQPAVDELGLAQRESHPVHRVVAEPPHLGEVRTGRRPADSRRPPSRPRPSPRRRPADERAARRAARPRRAAPAFAGRPASTAVCAKAAAVAVSVGSVTVSSDPPRTVREFDLLLPVHRVHEDRGVEPEHRRRSVRPPCPTPRRPGARRRRADGGPTARHRRQHGHGPSPRRGRARRRRQAARPRPGRPVRCASRAAGRALRCACGRPRPRGASTGPPPAPI